MKIGGIRDHKPTNWARPRAKKTPKPFSTFTLICTSPMAEDTDLEFKIVFIGDSGVGKVPISHLLHVPLRRKVH